MNYGERINEPGLSVQEHSLTSPDTSSRATYVLNEFIIEQIVEYKRMDGHPPAAHVRMNG